MCLGTAGRTLFGGAISTKMNGLFFVKTMKIKKVKRKERRKPLANKASGLSFVGRVC